ncbi:copper chaperone PCu(A)C [Streptomyces sp. NPDC058625]|uniref:copper chaperone PCu(A)C n=1 Tax=Streptomyces sp. NPDC058625 TaxID=3346564 RepID=UPI00364F05AB
MARRSALRGRCGLAAAALALAVTAGGCGGDDFSLPDWEAPGQNARIGDLMIRYAHLAEPRGEPWKPGDDVPAYVWLYNKGAEADRLVGASTPAADSVDIVGPDGKPLSDGVNLPENKLVELEPGKAHLVLRDLRQQVRGGDFIKITMRFQDAGSITFNIQSQIPAYDQSPSPSR